MKRYSIFDFRVSPSPGLGRGEFSARHWSKGRDRGVRGVSFIEVLTAVLILSVVAAGAVKTWSISSRAAANLRVTEITSKIATQEIEVIKAQKYTNVGNATTTKTTYAWYDKYGAIIAVSGVTRSTTLGSAPSNALYLATTTIGAPLDSSNGSISGLSLTGTTKDLIEVKSVVTNTAASKTYETHRTLMAFGGF